jgi:FtsH-binding integral membrane protein
MKKIISGITLLLATLPAWAQEAAEMPIPSAADASPVAMIVFALLFVVLIAAFFGYMWLQARKSEKDAR